MRKFLNYTRKSFPKDQHLLYVVPKNSFFNSGDAGSVMHALGIAEGFVENGWSVNLLSGTGLSGYKEYLPKTVILTEVECNKGFIRNQIWSLRLVLEFRRLLKNRDTDVFLIRYAVSKYFLCWILCWMAHRKGLVTVLEVNSFAYHYSFIPKPVRLLWGKAEIRFNLVYAVSETLSRTLREKKCAAQVIAVPNGASSKLIKVADNSTAGQKKKIRFVYLGTLIKYYDFEIIIAAFQSFVKRGYDSELHFFGSGMMEDQVKKISSGDSRIVFHGRYKKKNIGKLLDRKTDIMVLPPKVKSDMALSGGLSTKLFEYLSLSIAIVAPGMGEVNNILKDKKNAVLYEHDSEESLVNAFELIVTQPQLREKIAKNAYNDFLENHTWKARMSELTQAMYHIQR
jgi:glycosyltransferase involved in cell wall biosynthesis